MQLYNKDWWNNENITLKINYKQAFKRTFTKISQKLCTAHNVEIMNDNQNSIKMIISRNNGIK